MVEKLQTQRKKGKGKEEKEVSVVAAILRSNYF